MFGVYSYRVIILLMIILAGLGYTILWNNAPYLAPDSQGYIEVAVDLLDGKLDNLHHRTPGYPVLLILTN